MHYSRLLLHCASLAVEDAEPEQTKRQGNALTAAITPVVLPLVTRRPAQRNLQCDNLPRVPFNELTVHPTLLIFAIVAFIGIATPGPTVLLALTNGSRYGVRASVAGMIGAVLSDFVLVSAVALGLGALLAASEFWFSAVKWVGVVYLAYLGVRLLRSKGTIAIAAGGSMDNQASSRSIFLRCFLVAVTNPKGYLFFSALLPQFIVPTQSQLPQYVTLAVTFATIDFVVMLAYAAAGAQAILFLSAKRALWLDRICGGALLALSGSLALYRRQA